MGVLREAQVADVGWCSGEVVALRADGSQRDVDGGLEVFTARAGRGMDGGALAEGHHEPGQRLGIHTLRKVSLRRRTRQPFFESGLGGGPAGGQHRGDAG